MDTCSLLFPQPLASPLRRSLPAGRLADGQAAADQEILDLAVIYDTLPAAHHAMRTVSALLREFTPEMVFRTAFWRFDLLEEACWRIWATTDAVSSSLLVIATSQPSGLPGAVARWLKTCLPEKRGTDAALVALLGPEGATDSPDSPRLQFLERLAAAEGLAFFAPRPSLPDQASATTTTRLHHREEAITPTLERILHRVTAPAACGTACCAP